MTKNHKADSLHSTESFSHANIAGAITTETPADAITTETPADATTSGEMLLRAVWRARDKCHMLGVRDPLSGAFHNKSATGPRDAMERAKDISKNGRDAYFAPAEYAESSGRKAENAVGATGFWVDIDCGVAKAAKGAGYATCDDASLALGRFCSDAGLPQSTHIVSSGGGLHVYWVLDSRICRETWQGYARLLKDLTKALGFLVDHCRTADIASVLRVPGTLNYKYNPPRPVVLLHAAADFIERQAMFDAIKAAHARLCNVTMSPRSVCPVASYATRSIGHAIDATGCAAEVVKLASALAVLDPDCDEPTWTLHRLAPMARQARDYPELHDELYTLAQSWSSGELGGIASQAWRTAGNNGKTGEEYFDFVWNRFLTERCSGRPTTLRSIFRDAAMTGWIDPADQFEVINDASEVAA